ncbi:plasmid pRiA4b ORF-3 family protein [Actinomadura chokoriensis]|uniref:Plasmid pRiA4b ORF-3 family protein n=1 Tax=Actinomadura chokoriensis TaxID=454156 RepID=A0ABV4R9I6_9ACTN
MNTEPPHAWNASAFVLTRRVADWAADAVPVTASGMPRPADIPLLGRAVSILTPAKVNRLAYVPELHRAWRIAVATGLVEVGPKTAKATGLAPDTCDDAADRWLAGVREAISGDAEFVTLTVAAALAEDPAPVDLEEVCDRTDQALRARPWKHREAFRLFEDPVPEALALLGVLGMASDTALTPAGRWAFMRLRPPVITPSMGVRELLSALEDCHHDTAADLAAPWLDARPPAAAATELLAEAASSAARRRATALDLVEGLPFAGAAWQNVTADPVLGPAARRWQWEHGLRNEVPPEDDIWMTVEEMAVNLDADPAYVLDRFHDLPGRAADDRLAVVASSGHPERDAVLTALTALAARTSRPRVCQLKISLTGWGAWRRVMVRATATLYDLHQIIQTVFDWDDDHLHLFTAPDGRRYSDLLRADLDASDSGGVRICEVLPTPSVRLRYVYDLGDEWRHEITLQKIIPADPNTIYPACTAGNGDSPIEDSWTDEGTSYPTRPFNLEEISTRLTKHA